MKNPYLAPADFWQERDFGAKISATFEFIGAHWRRLGKCLVYFVLPFALLMGIGLGFFTNALYNQMGGPGGARSGGWHNTVTTSSSSPFDVFDFGGIALGFVGGTIAFLALMGTVFGYLRARLRLPADQPVTPATVWAELRARLGSILLLIGLLVGFSVLGAVFVALFGFYSFVGAGGPLVLALLVSPFVGALVTYLAVVLSLFFPVLWLEDRNVLATVGRCFQLIKGRWWSTFGLLIVAGIIQSMLSFVFILPQYAVMFGKALRVPGLDSDLLGILAQCIYAVGIIFTYSVSLLALAFQYFNLVERKEGVGLRLLVGELGQSRATPAVQADHYQPSDEGEY